MKKAIKAQKILMKIWRRLQSEDPKAWSLRKTAQKVGVSPGYMSRLFSGKSQLTLDLAEKFLLKLNAAPLEVESVRDCFQNKTTTPAETDQTALMDETYLVPATAEWLLGKWYRLPILDLLTTHQASSDPKWMAKRLGISTAEVTQSLQYFEKEGLAVQDQSKKWSKTYADIRFPATTSRETIRNYHRSQLKRIDQLLETQTTPKDYSRRLVIGISASVNVSQLEKVKVELEAALYRAARELSKGKCQEVYQLNLQLVPYTQEESP